MTGILAATPLAASGPLFPTPLHVTRQVRNPIAGTTAVLEEYGYGNRLATVRGARTAIADYEKGELTEIDREAGTYSVTRFDAIAKANQAADPAPAAAATAGTARTVPEVHGTGVKTTKSGRAADYFVAEIAAAGVKEKVEVGVDRKIAVSKEALEVLLGSAYPGVKHNEQEIIIAAAAPSRSGIATMSVAPAAETYALPVEQVVTYDVDGQSVEFRTTVMRVGNEPPPADVLAIPPAAKLVKSRIVEVNDELDALQHPTAPPRGNGH